MICSQRGTILGAQANYSQKGEYDVQRSEIRGCFSAERRVLHIELSQFKAQYQTQYKRPLGSPLGNLWPESDLGPLQHSKYRDLHQRIMNYNTELRTAIGDTTLPAAEKYALARELLLSVYESDEIRDMYAAQKAQMRTQAADLKKRYKCFLKEEAGGRISPNQLGDQLMDLGDSGDASSEGLEILIAECASLVHTISTYHTSLENVLSDAVFLRSIEVDGIIDELEFTLPGRLSQLWATYEMAQTDKVSMDDDFDDAWDEVAVCVPDSNQLTNQVREGQ